MDDKETILNLIYDFKEAYPEDVFPPLNRNERSGVVSRDRIGAHMARHVCDELTRQIRDLPAGEWKPAS